MGTDPTSGRARRLVRRAARQAGNAEAALLSELHEQHAAALWSYALTLTGDQGQARDVVQETLLRASRNPQLLDAERGSQRSSLYAVVRAIINDEWHVTHGRPVAGRRPAEPLTEASDPVVSRHLVAGALARLTEEHRDVLRECYFRGSSIAQAAKVLEITPDLVKSRAYYALRALRLAIEELGGVP